MYFLPLFVSNVQFPSKAGTERKKFQSLTTTMTFKVVLVNSWSYNQEIVHLGFGFDCGLEFTGNFSN